MIKLPTPRATIPVIATRTHWVLPPVSMPLAATLFAEALGVADDDDDDDGEPEGVVAAFAGPTVPPSTGRVIVGAPVTLAAAAAKSSTVSVDGGLITPTIPKPQ